MNILQMNWSARRLNALLSQMENPKRYLEIGVWKGHTIREIAIREKWGVDPNPLFPGKSMTEGTRIIKERSDDFFDTLPPDFTFDLVFLDGLHEARQTFRDLVNTMQHLSSQGIVVIDDVVPDDDWSAHPDQKTSLRLQYRHGKFDRRWQGDVWKVIPVVATALPGIDIYVVGASGSLKDNAQAVLVPNGSLKDRPDFSKAEVEFQKLERVRFSHYRDTNPHLFSPVPEAELIGPGFVRRRR